MSFFAELKRRSVFRVGIAYLIGAWLLAKIADLLIDNIGAPDWVMPPWRNGTTHVMFEPLDFVSGLVLQVVLRPLLAVSSLSDR